MGLLSGGDLINEYDGIYLVGIYSFAYTMVFSCMGTLYCGWLYIEILSLKREKTFIRTKR